MKITTYYLYLVFYAILLEEVFQNKLKSLKEKKNLLVESESKFVSNKSNFDTSNQKLFSPTIVKFTPHEKFENNKRVYFENSEKNQIILNTGQLNDNQIQVIKK